MVQLTYTSKTNMEVAITVYNGTGEAMTTLRQVAQKGSNLQTIDLSELPSGLYYINVQMRGEEQSIKVLKK